MNASARWLLVGIAVFAGFAIAAMSGCTVISKVPELRECRDRLAKVNQDFFQMEKRLSLCEDVLNEKRP